jgi:4'-phosphopantetheinyl transferase EntD
LIQLDAAAFRTETRCLAKRLDPSIVAECRPIQASDAAYLTAGEAAQLVGSVNSVRQASGAARAIARDLLAEAGCRGSVELIPQRPNGPCWPPSFLGSISHDAEFAAAAVAPRDALRGLGIDIEPAEPLPSDIYKLVVTQNEDIMIASDLLAARLLFVIKEAVYKATHPLDHIFLDHHDVDVDFETGLALTRTGHRVRFVTSVTGRMVAIAGLFASQPGTGC